MTPWLTPYQQGQRAAALGARLDDNPFLTNTPAWLQWAAGWKAQRFQAARGGR